MVNKNVNKILETIEEKKKSKACVCVKVTTG